MFKKGDKILYGQTGVCEVADICEKILIKNEKKLYYVLKPYHSTNNIIYAPVDSDKVFMRKIMTRQEADNLILKIPEIKAEIKEGDFSIEDCKAQLSSHNCDNLIELTARIYEKRKTAQSQKKKLGLADEKYMRLAENLLFGELAAALDIPIDNVEDYIKKSIKK